MQVFDDMLRGNLAERSGAKFVPGGLNVQFTKDALLKDEFDEWLARIICYAFSVPPTAFVRQITVPPPTAPSRPACKRGWCGWVMVRADNLVVR